MNSKRHFNSGFTIVELIVVIIVIGILAGIVVLGYGKWRESTAQKEVQSDLQMAASAMESAKNFGSGYPASLPTTFQASPNVILTYGFGDSSSFCLDAKSQSNSNVVYYINPATDSKPLPGKCSGVNGLVGWWRMNGNANDSSVTGNNGTVNGATLTSGKNTQASGAYTFNGTSSYIGTPTISIPTAVTASAWVYSTNFNQNGFVIGKNTVNTQWELFFESPWLKWRGGAPPDNNTQCALPSNDAWHHIVGTQNGTATALYIDGTLCTSATSSAIGNGTDTVDIGRFNSSYYYNGSIDDVRLYNRALSASEIQALYNAGAL